MMPIYAAAAFGAVILCTAVLLLLFSRFKILSPITILSVALASLISIAAFPFIHRFVSQLGIDALKSHGPLPITVAAIILCLLLDLLLCILVVMIAPKSKKPARKAAAGSQAAGSQEAGSPEEEEQTATAANDNYLEQIYDKLIYENSRETPNIEEITDKAENNLEISVDSNENIDKMGIENSIQDSTIMTIEGCLEEAFKLKETGDAEGAIRNFTDALDKNPPRELTFWIVLDICVLYKSLGQAELAYDILNSYHEAFGDLMNASVKEEIEFNLFDIYA